MKKTKLLSAVLAIAMGVSCFAGCGSKTAKADYIAKYDGLQINAKHYNLVAEVFKKSYLQSSGYATSDVKEEDYMTLKHILVLFTKEDGTTRTEEEALSEAQKIKSEITDDNFDALVEQYSEDPGSKSKPQGYTFAHNDGTMVKEFDDAGWALQVGQVSDPVKTSYGYHIIKRVELNKEDLPKNPSEINWDEEKDTNGEKAIDNIRKNAYDWVVQSAILVKLAKNDGMSVADDEYDTEKSNAMEALGGEEEAKKLFDKYAYSEDEIKEFVDYYTLPNNYYKDYSSKVDCEALFEEFKASDEFKQMSDYYTQMGQELDYSAYNPDDSMLLQMIQSYAFNKMYKAEEAKVEKNDNVYNSFK